jgi:hypothetical protein
MDSQRLFNAATTDAQSQPAATRDPPPATVVDHPGPKKIGHRFERGHKYYQPKQPLDGDSEFKRLKRKMIRALKKEFGPDLTAPQLAHINTAADAGARLQLQAATVSPKHIVGLMVAQRQALEAIVG